MAQAAIVACERCPRLRDYCRRVAREKRRAYREETYWARPVPGFGDPAAWLVLVGLAPAAHGANRTGRMFTGDGAGGSGDFLVGALYRAGFANLATSQHAADGLTLTGAFMMSAVRCAPPANKPTPAEAAACLTHLDAEFAALRGARVIVALGRIGFDACLKLYRRRGFTLSPAPRFGHGSVDQLPDGRVLLGCYHPSRQNTHTGRLTSRMLDAVFTRARALSGDTRASTRRSRRADR